jgi:hypothetical protein
LRYTGFVHWSSVATRYRVSMAAPKPPKWNGSFFRKQVTPSTAER